MRPAAARQSRPFLVAYALAWAGGSIAYTPFLTLLLPFRFTQLAGTEDVNWLALCATVGAIAAGLSNIVWGWASDRWPAERRQRLGWALAGLLATAVAVAAITQAGDPARLVAAVAVWQVALNLLLAPLAAYAADSVADSQKGELGGLLSFAPALAALSVIGVAASGTDFARQMAVILLFVALATTPLFLWRRAGELGRVPLSTDPANPTGYDRRTLVALWLARLFVQIAEGLLFLFIFYFLRSVSGGALSLSDYAWTNASVQLLAAPVAVAVGRLSDRYARRKLPLMAMLALVASGLAGMAVAHSWLAVICCYGLFLTGSNSFFALHAAFAMQQLPNPRHFGRDLGVFNLTNTLPALIGPMLAASVIGHFGYHSLLGLLAVMMVVPALLLASLRLR